MEKTIKYKDQYLTLMNYKEPLTEIKDGFGYYGCLLSTTDGEKVQCAICGKLFGELGSHVHQAHGISAHDYKEKFGLSFTTSLISEKIRGERKERTLKWVEEMSKKYGADWKIFFRNHAKKGNAARKTKPKTLVSLEKKNKNGICPDQLLEKIKEVVKILGRTPSKNEFIAVTGTQRYIHLIYKTFGSWVNTLDKLTLKVSENTGNSKEGSRRTGNEYDDEELLEYLRIFYEQNKKIPTETDCRRGLIPDSNVYVRHFGSLPKARELAGIFDVPTRWGVKQ